MTTKKLIQRIKSEREHISDQAKDLGLIFNVNVTDEMTDTLVEMVNRINRYTDLQMKLNQHRLDHAFTDRMKMMLQQKMDDEENE